MRVRGRGSVCVYAWVADLCVNVVVAIRPHVEHRHLGTESGRHSAVHLIAGPHQLLGQLQVTAVQAVQYSQCQRAGQEARQMLLAHAHTHTRLTALFPGLPR